MFRRLHSTVAILACAGAALGLSGCTGTAGPTTTRTVSASVPSAPTAPTTQADPPSSAGRSTEPSSSPALPPATAAPSSPAPVRRDPSAPKGQCPDAAIAVTVKYDPEGAGAGQRTSWVIFRNTGSSPCVLEGAPGVSLVGGGNGTQLGRPADRPTPNGSVVTIPAGSYAGALLNYTYVDENGGNFNTGGGDPTCKAAPADGYRVYPPHSFRAYFAPFKTYACTTSQRWINVQPVQPADKVGVQP